MNKQIVLNAVSALVTISVMVICPNVVYAAGLANTSWPMFRQNLYHTGISSVPVSGPAGINKWSFQANDCIRSSPAIAPDGSIYFGSCDSNLYALNPDGSIRWFYRTGNGAQSSPAIASDGTVYIGSSDNYFYAINSDGTLKWKYLTGGSVESSAAIAPDGTVYFGSEDMMVYALNPDGTVKWKYQTGNQVQSSPALGPDGTVYIGSYDTYLYALHSDGTLKWKYQTGDMIYSSPALGPDGTVYFGSNDNNIYALNPDGTLKWKYLTGNQVQSSPVLGPDGVVYTGSNNGILYVLNPDGTLKWKYQSGDSVLSSPALGSDGTVYFGSNDTNLYALNPNGTLKWKFKAGAGVNASPIIGPDGSIYIGSNDHYLYAFTYQSNLSWSGEPNYVSAGVSPLTGYTDLTSFNFRIKYTDPNNAPPKSGYPKLHVLNNNVEISNSPFPMSYATGTNTSGAVYSTLLLLGTGTQYTYYFEAYDVWGITATNSPTLVSSGPVVAVPVITSITPYVGYRSGPMSITNLAGNGWFAGNPTVKLSLAGQSDILATNVNVISPGQISCVFDLTMKTTGYWDVVVSTGGDSSVSATLPGSFQICPMTVTSVNPSEGSNLGSVSINNLSGAGFVTGSTVKIMKSGQSDIVATNVNVLSPQQIACTFDLTGAVTGYWDIVVSTGGPGSYSAELDSGLLVSIIFVSSMTPSIGYNSGPVSITDMAGGGFTSNSTVKLAKAGQSDIVATNINVVSQEQITCMFDLTLKATGYWDVVVSSGGAGSATDTFTGGFFVSPIRVLSITPGIGYNEGSVSITNLAGGGFVTGSTVKLTQTGQSDLAAGNVNVVSPSQITCNFDMIDTATGYWNVVVTTGSLSGTLINGFLVQLSGTITRYIDDSIDCTVILKLECGEMIVFIPAHTFGENVWLTVAKSAIPASDRSTIKLSGIGIVITNDKNIQPQKEITITMNYRDSDIEGLDGSKLSLVRYDSEHNRWLTEQTAVYTGQNKIVGNTMHLSIFAMAQLAPAQDLSTVKVFPNPYNPINGNLTIDNLTADAEIKIFNIAGELVATVSYPSANGRTTWDGRNNSGKIVASGVYLALVKNSAGKKIVKIAVEK
jgi:outer membrane protein assembly factor BamB